MCVCDIAFGGARGTTHQCDIIPGQASARTGRHGQAQPAWASAAVRRWQPQGLKARLWISWRSPPALSVPGPEARAAQLQPGRHGQAPAALAVRANIYKNR